LKKSNKKNKKKRPFPSGSRSNNSNATATATTAISAAGLQPPVPTQARGAQFKDSTIKPK